ncbi:MAG: hypothetical protein L3K26_16035, partial [Candidatus Hydrogenedentes bacterium]|nr:hypothetical protein [Candidatus Hydrogenedentota bacterium]
MQSTKPKVLIASVLSLVSLCSAAWCGSPLAGTAPLNMTGDLAEQMVSGIHRDLDKRIADVRVQRTTRWGHGVTDAAFITERRTELATILGTVDKRLPAVMETVGQPGNTGPVAEGEGYAVYPVRWPVFDGVFGEGYLVEPTGTATASLLVLPDADEEPESVLGLNDGVSLRSKALHQFASTGCRIVVLSLVNREDTWSGNPKVRMTNQPHREWIYRGAYEMGRHIIGYEVQGCRSALDWLTRKGPDLPVGIMGYGEGGLVALSTSALDTRVRATVVSGYFGPREGLWEEPIYRNVWALLKNFGDAELGAMIAPRTLIVENATPPAVTGPPMTKGRSHGAAPGVVPHPSATEVRNELERAADYHPATESKGWLYQTGEKGGQTGQTETMAAL